MIATMKNDQDARYSVVELCLALGVSRSGFYDHKQKQDCERRREDGVLAQKISLLFLEGRRTYGSRRIQKGLLRAGIACGKKRIVRLMRDQVSAVESKPATFLFKMIGDILARSDFPFMA
jgi:putative transposase